jgi:hypothetical protein
MEHVTPEECKANQWTEKIQKKSTTPNVSKILKKYYIMLSS